MNGNEISQTDPMGNVTKWTYDEFGNKLSRTLPGGQQETWTYDMYGNVHTHTDFDGNVATYVYWFTEGGDAANLDKVYSITYAGTGQTTQTVTYTYDKLGRTTIMTDTGNGGTSNPTTYTYDSITGIVASITSPQGT